MVSTKNAVSCAVALLIVCASVAGAVDLKKAEKRTLNAAATSPPATPAPATPAPGTMAPLTPVPQTQNNGGSQCGNASYFDHIPACGPTMQCEQSLCTCLGLPSTCDLGQGFGSAADKFPTCFSTALQCIIAAGLSMYVPTSFDSDPNPCVAWAWPIARDYADYYNGNATSRLSNPLVKACNATGCFVAKNALGASIDFTAACTGFNATSVPTFKAGSTTQFTCPDGTLAANLATCACSVNAAVSGLGAIFRRQISSDKKFDASQPLAATAYATYKVASGNCSGFDFSPFLTYHWELFNGSTLVASVPGSAFVTAAGMLVPNTTYVLSLFATDMFDKDTSLNFTFTAVAPDPVVIIKQGTQLRVSTTKSTVINVTVIDSFPGSSPSAVWSCTGACPTANQSTATTFTLPSGYTAGAFTITFTYKGKFSASINVTAVADDIPSVQIILATDSLSKSPVAFFRGKPAGFASAVSYSGALGTFAWTLNGQDAGSAKYVNVDTTNTALQFTSATNANAMSYSYNTLTLRVNNAAGTTYGETSLTFVVIDKFTAITLAIVDDTNATATAAIALTDTLKFTVTSSIVSVFGATVEYAFAYQDNNRFVPLAVIPDPSTPNVFRGLTPFPKVTGATTFVVRARFNGAEISNATASMSIAAPANIAALAATQLASLASVSGAGNSVKAAGQLMGLLQGSTDSALVASIAAQVADSLVKNIVDASALSTDEQGALMASISVAVSAGTDNAAKKALSDKLVALLSSAVSGANFDVTTNGDAALNALSSMDLSSSANVLADLARAVGNNPNQPVGVPVTMRANNVEIVAVRQSMSSLGGQSLSGTGGSMVMPADLATSLSSVSADSIVAAGSTSYGNTNPYSANTTGSAVVSYELSAGGRTIPVSGLATPMEVTLTPVAGASNLKCFYWSTSAKTWANDGVETAGGVCKTTHLTAFSLFQTSTATGSASTAAVSLAVALLAVLLHVVMA